MKKSFIFLAPIFLLFICLSTATIANAATYYIDFENGSDSNSGTTKDSPWKRCPGMNGFEGSYSHNTGDTFIFKGGVVWPASTMRLTISYSGAEGKVDTYRSDKSWFKGSYWSEPIFDAQGTLVATNSMIYIFKKKYIRISGIKFINGGIPGGAEGGRAIFIYLSGNIEIDNCRFIPFSHHAIVGAYKSGNYASVLIHDNEFSDSANFIEIGVVDGMLDGLEIYRNIFRDPWSMMVYGDHADGIHCFRVKGVGQIYNLKIHGNKFKGNWGGRDGTSAVTAMIFLEDGAQVSPLIYNNVLTYQIENVAVERMYFRTLMLFSGTNNPRIFNNTLQGRNNPDDMSVGIDINSGATNAVIKNNIVTGIKNCIRIGGGASVTAIDNNLLWPIPGTSVGIVGTDFCNWNEWQNVYGFDRNGQNKNPLFVNGAYPYDLSLRENSPARDTGADISAEFMDDFIGTARPIGEKWDIGAYEYAGGSGDGVILKTPTSLKIAP